MTVPKQGFRVSAIVVGAGMFSLLWPTQILAHCDTVNGPVITDAKQALEKGDPSPVLKWVKKEHEEEIREAFRKTLAVRTKGPEARELADLYFFETLVRVHRTGEGAAYTGLKPADSKQPASVAAVDRALESGSADSLVTMITDIVAAGIRDRFRRALAAKEHAGQSIDSGREFVAAYVEFMHYAERLYLDAKGGDGHHHEEDMAPEGNERAERDHE